MIKKKTKKDEISYFEVLNVLFGGLEVGCPRNKQKNFSFKNKYIAIFYWQNFIFFQPKFVWPSKTHIWIRIGIGIGIGIQQKAWIQIQ